MSIDPSDLRSPSQQIAAGIRKEIREGRLAPGSQIPSERELVDRYGVAPQTARQAVALLKTEGLVIGRTGRGVFVREQPLLIRVGSDRYARWRRDMGKAPFQAEIEAMGLTPKQDILELGEVPAPRWVADWFTIEPETPVFVRRRKTWVEDTPTQIADSYYQLDTVQGTRIQEVDTGPGGGYARLEEKGYRLTHFREEIRIRMPTPEEAGAIRLAPGVPVAHLHRIAFTADGPIEVFEAILAGDKHTFAYDFPAPD
ncbi:MAG: GntR family transcriptional regulator [Candidatus Dormibacteraceae bacterium]